VRPPPIPIVLPGLSITCRRLRSVLCKCRDLNWAQPCESDDTGPRPGNARQYKRKCRGRAERIAVNRPLPEPAFFVCRQDARKK
jgi:hypothetical protein